ncbi:Protein TRANSPORT INHIBITOR RESPONSE 1, partial [Linum perenne]
LNFSFCFSLSPYISIQTPLTSEISLPPFTPATISHLRRRRAMDRSPKRSATSSPSSFPDEVLEQVLSMLNSHKDRSSVSLVCKDWYNAESWSRTHVFIGNCYSVSPEIVARRFPRIRSVTLKGKPRFSDFNLVPENWGADVQSWLTVFASEYPFLEELRLKRMRVTDESLEFLALNFPNFKALSLLSCDGFSSGGLAAITANCKNLTELDIQENGIEETGEDFLSCFPEDFNSLEVLNFSSLCTEVEPEVLESLVSRCKSLRVLKVNQSVPLDCLIRLLVHAPQLTELGAGSFSQDLTPRLYKELEEAFSHCKNLKVLSGMWDATALNLPAIYQACSRLTFLNLSYSALQCHELANLLPHCPSLRRLWVLDSVGDEGLDSIGPNCPSLTELRVFPSDPFDDTAPHGVTESGIISISKHCHNLNYILYFCRQMTNDAITTLVHNNPHFTHFRLCIMTPHQPDHSTNSPMDEAFHSVVKTCKSLRRLSVSGLLTDLAFNYIGQHGTNLETLSVAFAGSSDVGMQYVLEGCPKLRKLEIRDSPFGDAALMSGLERYESMRSLWMSACGVTMKGCRDLAREMPMLNVEVMQEEDEGVGDECDAGKVYVYRSVAGPRGDAPPSVITVLSQ